MMVRWLVVMITTVLSYGTASAEWVRTGGTDKYDGYVDMATIGQTGKNVMLWTLRDFTATRPGAPGSDGEAEWKITCWKV